MLPRKVLPSSMPSTMLNGNLFRLTLDLSLTFVASNNIKQSLARVLHSSQYKQLWAGKLVGDRKYD